MTKQSLYSLQQIANALGIPQSTVAYYRKNYADFMPSTRLKGKRYPLYELQAMEVVRLVRELSESGKEQHEIIAELDNLYPKVIEETANKPQNEHTNEQPTTMLATTQKQGEIISRLIGQQTELIKSQDTTLEAYRNQLAERERRIWELEARLDQTKAKKQRTEVDNEPVVVLEREDQGNELAAQQVSKKKTSSPVQQTNKNVISNSRRKKRKSGKKQTTKPAGVENKPEDKPKKKSGGFWSNLFN